MFKIQTLNTIAAVGLNQFPRERYEVASEIKHPDAIILRSHQLTVENIPGSVKIIGRAGVGLNNIPVASLTEQGIPVLNTPGANANAVRELVIAGMLLASRNICQAWQFVNELESTHDEFHQNIEAYKKKFVGFELLGKTLGIVGLGSIGVKVANSAICLGMKVIGFDPDITVNRAWELSASVKKANSLDDLLMEADFVSFHVPLIEQTKNMIDYSRFHLLKPSVVLLNFARDGIINHEALLQALSENKINKYVTDFPLPIYKNHPGVICLPHLGASTKEAEENCAMMIVRQIRDFLEFGAITHSVNFPTLEVSPNYNSERLAIVNANIPNMVAQISACLAKAGINILSLSNKSLNQIAYTVIDLSSTIQESALKEIREIKGVLQLRLLKKMK